MVVVSGPADCILVTGWSFDFFARILDFELDIHACRLEELIQKELIIKSIHAVVLSENWPLELLSGVRDQCQTFLASVRLGLLRASVILSWKLLPEIQILKIEVRIRACSLSNNR